MHTNELFSLQLRSKEQDNDIKKLWTELFLKIRRSSTLQGMFLICFFYLLHLDARNVCNEIEAFEETDFKRYFQTFWLSEKFLPLWIDATRPATCESKGLWRTNNYTEAQIKRICHTYLRRKQAVSFSEYLKILGRDIMLDSTTFAKQLQYGKTTTTIIYF